MVSVTKRNTEKENFKPNKILTAIVKASERATETNIVTLEDIQVYFSSAEGVLHVDEIHHYVVELLNKKGMKETAACYKSYVDYKRTFVSTMKELQEKSRSIITHGDRENANFESTLVSTQQSLIRGYLTKELYKQNYLSVEEKEAIEDGYIYLHDMRDLIFNTINCCLFDISTVLRDGFEMANLKYSEPNSVLSALQLIGDVTLAASAQQYGGFTLPDIDKVLVPYVKKSINKHKINAEKYGIQDIDLYVEDMVEKELSQGFQSLEMKLNSVPSSRGDFAFTTLTFGNLDGEDKDLQQKVCKAILNQRMIGNPVVFPKLVLLFSWKQYENCPLFQELYDLSIKCSCDNLYPDYLAIDTKGYVSDMYRESGEVINPMGCRAYLSDFKDIFGKTYFTGRANIGAASLNLPMIYMKAIEDGVDFYETLTHYLKMIRTFLQKRYKQVGESKASTNPLAFTQGGMKGGFLKPDEEIAPLLKGYTASFGISALNELNVLMSGVNIHEEDEPTIDPVVDFIIEYIETAKEEDGNLYAAYGVPAESLAGTQLKQFKDKYGIIENVSDREYFSNSFHCHVSAEISPFEKQDREFENFHKINGGHIQYSRVDTSRPELVKGVVLRAMDMGFYAGVNANHTFCDDCGWTDKESRDVCGNCGSDQLMEINRVCGYLGFSKQKGNTRFNDSKLAELKERVSM